MTTGAKKKSGGKGGGAQKEKVEMVVQRGTCAGKGIRVQRRRQRRDGWTLKRRALFLNVLQESCNVHEASRVVGIAPGRAYGLRARDPAFAAQWAEALEQGYAELEMTLLRQAIHGTETTETVDDGKGEGAQRVKKVHSYPHAVALRLFLAHKGAVSAFREEHGISRPGSDEVRAEIEQRMAALRPGAGGDEEPEDGGDGDGGDDGEEGALA